MNERVTFTGPSGSQPAGPSTDPGHVSARTGRRSGSGPVTRVAAHQARAEPPVAAQATALTTYSYGVRLRQTSSGLDLTVPGFGGGFSLSDRETSVISTLLIQPTSQVEDRLSAHWAELTAASTPTDRAAQLLGTAAPAPARPGSFTC